MSILPSRRALLELGAGSLLLACSANPPAPPAPPGPPPPEPLTIASSGAAPAPVATAPVAPEPRERERPPAARKVELPGLSLGMFVEGQGPSPEHPKGTIVALGHSTEGGPVSLVAVDVASGREVKRLASGVRGKAMLRRDGDRVHVGGQDEASLRWITADLSLELLRALRVEKMGSEQMSDYLGFDVFDDHAFVVDGGVGAIVHVLDAKGARLARHDCRGGFYHPGSARLERAGMLAVVTNLVDTGEPGRSHVCAFRLDGKGPAQRARFPEYPSFFVHDGRLHLTQGDGVRRLDERLRPEGPVLADPRADRPSHGDPQQLCAGLGRADLWQVAWLSGTFVVRRAGCCGSRGPSGLFLCDVDPSPP